MDKGVWWTTVHGVTKSQTWLKWLSTQHTHMILPSPQSHVNKTENMENITKIKNNLFSAFLGFLFIIPTYINNSWLWKPFPKPTPFVMTLCPFKALYISKTCWLKILASPFIFLRSLETSWQIPNNA